MHTKKNVAVCPGGTREMRYCSHSDSIVYLVKRKRAKWIQYAWEEKAVLVPILSIGENSGYNTYNNVLLGDFFQKLIGYPFVFPFGRFKTFWPKKTAFLTLKIGTFVDTRLFNSSLAVEEAYYNSLEEVAARSGVSLQWVEFQK
jgi:hypothetical protein